MYWFIIVVQMKLFHNFFAYKEEFPLYFKFYIIQIFFSVVMLPPLIITHVKVTTHCPHEYEWAS